MPSLISGRHLVRGIRSDEAARPPALSRLADWYCILRVRGLSFCGGGSALSIEGFSAFGLGPGYGSAEDEGFIAKYRARCHCGSVRYEVCADPVDAKICHCRACQVLHGAQMQWAAIFHKRDVRLVAGVDDLRFYNSELDRRDRVLPCKVSCAHCGTLIADEGRRMWLAFPTLFDFGTPPQVPDTFRPRCHIFYATRVTDIDDGLPKWSGHKNESRLL